MLGSAKRIEVSCFGYHTDAVYQQKRGASRPQADTSRRPLPLRESRLTLVKADGPPHTRVEETVFLTPPAVRSPRDHMSVNDGKSATWLVTTGMRFSEATALAAADIDADAKTCRINKAWKYSGDYRPEIGPPKTKKSIRTISLPPAALEVIDLTAPSFLFTNGAGNPVRAQEFYNGGGNRPRQRHQSRSDEVATSARPTPYMRVLDDLRRRTPADHPAAPRPRVHPDDHWRLRPPRPTKRPGRCGRDRIRTQLASSRRDLMWKGAGPNAVSAVPANVYA